MSAEKNDIANTPDCPMASKGSVYFAFRMLRLIDVALAYGSHAEKLYFQGHRVILFGIKRKL
jgi:hypothetical protein